MKMLEIIETETDFSVVDDTLREPEHELVQARKQNAKLQNALREARDEIAALRAEVDKLCAPPSSYGVYLSANADDTVDVLAHGRKVKVRLNPAIKAESLRPGQELALNEALNVVAAAGYEIQGDVVVLKERLGRPHLDGSEVGLPARATAQDRGRRSRARRGPRDRLSRRRRSGPRRSCGQAGST